MVSLLGGSKPFVNLLGVSEAPFGGCLSRQRDFFQPFAVQLSFVNVMEQMFFKILVLLTGQ